MASSCASLSRLSGKTDVLGKGPIKRNIKDVTGTRRQLKTHIYYVPTASIRLCSPQACIGNNDKARLLLTSKGTYLPLKCFTLLQFPLNPSSNLPFVLTETAINRNQKLHREHCKSIHFTALQFAESLWFRSTTSNARVSNFPLKDTNDPRLGYFDPTQRSEPFNTDYHDKFKSQHGTCSTPNPKQSRFTCQKKRHKLR